MKLLTFKIALTAIISLLLISCKNTPKELTEDERKFIQKHENIAYAPLNFGMHKFKSDSLDINYVQIKDHSLFVLQSFDQKDELYEVKLISKSKSANYLDNELKLVYLDIAESIINKYGEPVLFNNYPSILDLSPGKSFICGKWEIGEKEITLSVFNTTDSKFEIWCRINHKGRYARFKEIENLARSGGSGQNSF